MEKRLVIDLEQCDGCDRCAVECAAFYRARPGEHGMLTLRERATFSVVCRRCEDASCIAACTFDALERGEDGVLVRHNLRCVSCKCCTLACPFGTIYPDVVPFYTVACAACAGQAGEEPPCVASCTRGALAYRAVAEDENGVTLLGEHLAVRGPAWEKEKV